MPNDPPARGVTLLIPVLQLPPAEAGQPHHVLSQQRFTYKAIYVDHWFT
jgi:hypothetical protein